MEKKTKILPVSEEGQKLFQLLRRACGLQDFNVRTLEVRFHYKETISFTAECLIGKEDIAAAFDKCQEPEPLER